MRGRMIHAADARGAPTAAPQRYDVHGRAIHAADRAGLNRRLLDAAAAHPRVALCFHRKLTGADFEKRVAWFEPCAPDAAAERGRGPRPPEVRVPFDLLLGADGAHSAVRAPLLRAARGAFRQEHIDALWCEFRIAPRRGGRPATDDDDDDGGDGGDGSGSPEPEFALSPHHLHIWPGRWHMFIAIPSADRSFTCTLFATPGTFAALAESPDALLQPFFAANFPGVCPDLIPPEELRAQFLRNPHLPLVSLRCAPHAHGAGAAALLGDAAHAMVPFYGQGLNAGLEGVRALFATLDAHGVGPSRFWPARLPPGCAALDAPARRARALAAYSAERVPDAAAIGALAMGNYREMRADVAAPWYRAKKGVEEALMRALPRGAWASQYVRVSFENQRYSEVVRAVRGQDRLLAVLALAAAAGAGWLAWWVARWRRVVRARRWVVRLVQAILRL